MDDRYSQTIAYTARLIAGGLHVFSPIAHNVTMIKHCGIPNGWNYWKLYDATMLADSGYLLILPLDGWEDSEGIQEERQLARDLGKPEIILDLQRIYDAAYIAELCELIEKGPAIEQEHVVITPFVQSISKLMGVTITYWDEFEIDAKGDYALITVKKHTTRVTSVASFLISGTDEGREWSILNCENMDDAELTKHAIAMRDAKVRMSFISKILRRTEYRILKLIKAHAKETAPPRKTPARKTKMFRTSEES